MDLLQDKIVTK